jgi:hypothetical protein
MPNPPQIVPKYLGQQESPDVTGAPSGHPKDHENDAPKKPTTPVVPPIAPPVVSPLPAPSMDAQAIIDELSKVVDFQKAETPYGSNPTEHPLSIYIGGIGAAIDSLKYMTDIETVLKAQDEMLKFELQMRPGEVAHILVSATPQGSVSIVRLPSPNAPVISDGKDSSFRTTITAPNFDRIRDVFKSPARKKKELDAWYSELTQEQKDAIEKYRQPKIPLM